MCRTRWPAARIRGELRGTRQHGERTSLTRPQGHTGRFSHSHSAPPLWTRRRPMLAPRPQNRRSVDSGSTSSTSSTSSTGLSVEPLCLSDEHPGRADRPYSDDRLWTAARRQLDGGSRPRRQHLSSVCNSIEVARRVRTDAGFKAAWARAFLRPRKATRPSPPPTQPQSPHVKRTVASA